MEIMKSTGRNQLTGAIEHCTGCHHQNLTPFGLVYHVGFPFVRQLVQFWSGPSSVCIHCETFGLCNVILN